MAARAHPLKQFGHLGRSVFELGGKHRGLDELNLFLGKIEAGFQLGEQIEQLAPQMCSGPARPPASCSSALQLRVSGSIDHAQHGFGLREIDPAGQKSPQRELAGPRGAGAALGQRGRHTASSSGGEPSV